MTNNVIKVFNTADTNHDGVLDRTEFENFLLKCQEDWTARGTLDWFDALFSAEELDAIHSMINGYNKFTAGISIGDWWKFWGH